MPKNSLMMLLMSRLMAPAQEGADLPGDTTTLDDEGHQPSTPEDRGDILPSDQLDAEALQAVAAGASEDEGQAAADEGQQQAEAQASAEAEEAAKANSGSVPHARFNEVNARRKAAEQEAERLRAELEAERAGKVQVQKTAENAEQQKGVATDFDVGAKEKAYLAALMDGDEDTAQKLRTEINEHLLEQATTKAVEKVRAENAARDRADAEQKAAQALQETAAAVVSDYPFLDEPAHAEVLDMIEARRDALIAKGTPVHQALRQAADFIAPRFAPEGFTPAKSSEKPTPKTDLRQAAATERGAKSSLAQPPVPAAGMGNRATGGEALNVETMSDEQWERLPESEKKRMRGD